MTWHWSALHYIALVALHCNDIPNDRRSPTSQGFEVRSFRPCFRLRNGASLASLRSMGWCSHHWWRIWGRVIDHHQSISVPDGGLLTPDSCGFNISHHFVITSLVQQELQIEKKDTSPLTRNLSISVICIKKTFPMLVVVSKGHWPRPTPSFTADAAKHARSDRWARILFNPNGTATNKIQ